MNDHVKNIRIPVVYQGVLVERNPDEIDARLYVVDIDTDIGNIPRLRAKLCFNPGNDTNYTKGTPVLVLVEMYYSLHTERYTDLCYDGKHTILGMHHPFSVKPVVENKNINADLAGGIHSYLHPQNHSGMIVEDGGAVNLITNGLVTHRMAPGGYGMHQESDSAYAQNFHRVIMNQIEGFHWAREHFGMYLGKDVADVTANAADATGKSVLMGYRRYVPKSLSADYWVSSCEGAYCPWVGPNNEVEEVKDGSDILFSKVINSLTNRVTITAGKSGPSFFQLRVDTVTPMTEKLVGPGPECLPVVSLPNASINISEKGEFVGEFGITPAGVATIVTIAADGTFSIKSMSKFTVATNDIEFDAVNSIKLKSPAITLDGDVKVTGRADVNGALKSGSKNLSTADLVDFLSQNLPTLYISAAPGSPCVVNPAAVTALSAQSAVPGGMKTNTVPTPPLPPPAVVTPPTLTTPLKST